MANVYINGVPSGIRPVVAAALGFNIQGMVFVAKGEAAVSSCLPSGIR
jgi:hypothetical protein